MTVMPAHAGQHRRPWLPARRGTCLASAALGLLLLAAHAVHAATCYDSAAAYQHVNPLLLRAIAWKESHGQAQAVHQNANGSIDRGVAQINSIHLSELAHYGIAPAALFDECVNEYVAAWLLKQKMVKYGNTWTAVGAYHSETPDKRDAYALDIEAILQRWGKLKEIAQPLPNIAAK